MAKPAPLPGPAHHSPAVARDEHLHAHPHHAHGEGLHDHHTHHHHASGGPMAGQRFGGVPAMNVERADPPRLSLMALSALQRLALATPVIGMLWLLTLWVLRNG